MLKPDRDLVQAPAEEIAEHILVHHAAIVYPGVVEVLRREKFAWTE